MINNELFKKIVTESNIGVPRLSALTGIPKTKIEKLMDSDSEINAVQIQALSDALEMTNAQRRNTFFNRNLPMD